MKRIHQENINGAQALLQSLINQGVETIFGYPGGSITPVYDKLHMYPELRHLLTRHEQGSVHAAQGFARASGQIGVCMATSGPGATNLITGIADAMLDSNPIVCISAQVPSTALGTDFFQEADMINMTVPVTKWNYQVTCFDEIAPTIAKAFYIAGSGRPGPVYIEFTKDALVAVSDYNWEPCTGIRSYRPYPEINSDDITKAAKLLNKAQKPLILVGNGVKISGAEQALIAVAERAGIPMASTLMGLSAVPSSHPLYIGMLGMHGNIAGNLMTQESDIILAVGMRFSDRVTGNVKTYAPKAQIIHIELDPIEIDKNIPTTVAINSDARPALEALLPLLEGRSHPEWMDVARKYQQQEWNSVIKRQLCPTRPELTMGETIKAVSDATKGDAIVVTDVGQHQMFAARYSHYNRSCTMITSGGLGTMGFGLPAAIGAKVACPEEEVIVFIGDGGFQMTMQELGTMLHWGIGVKVVVLNNEFLGMVRQWQELFMEKRYSSTVLINPDFVKIADAYNIPAERITEREELAPAIERMLNSPGAYFLEVAVGREDNVFPMIPGGASLTDLLYTE